MEITKGKISWVNITKPTKADIDSLEKTYGFHKIILKELERPSARPRVENYDDYLYFIYYVPIYDTTEKTSRTAEIDFLITKTAVITVHYEPIEVLEQFKAVEFESSLDLTYQIITSLFEFQERQLQHIREKVEYIGRALFKNNERPVLEMISRVKRDVSEYRIIVRRQAPILRSFVDVGGEFWNAKSKIYLNDLVGEHIKVASQLEDYREAVSDFEDTNNQLMNVKTMGVTKTFTILAFLTFPMMLFAALFSTNVKNMPLVDHPYSFWIMLAIMAAAMTGMYFYFKTKDWL